MGKLISITHKTICFAMVVIMIWWSYCALRFSSAVTAISFDNNSKSTVLLLLLLLILCSISIYKRDWVKRIPNLVQNGMFLRALMAFVALMQITVVVSLGPIYFNWDPNQAIVESLNPTIWSKYLSNYPNNILEFRIVSLVLSLLPQSWHTQIALTFVLQMLNIIIIDVSIVGMYAVVKQYDDSIASYIFISMCLLLGIGGLCITPYTDSFCLPFVVGQFAVVCKINNGEKSVVRFGWQFLLGVLILCGYLIKPSSIIPMIAYVMLIIVQQLMCKKVISLLLSLLFMFGGVFFADCVWSLHESKMSVLKSDKSQSLPMTHFMMMGLKGNGGFDSEDVNNTLSFKTKQEKIDYNISMIETRLSDYGPLEYLNFLMKKSQNVFTDGSLGFDNDGSNGPFTQWTNQDVPDAWSAYTSTRFARNIASYYKHNERNHQTFRVLMQVFWVLFVAFMLYGTVRISRRALSINATEDWGRFFILLAIFGGVAFLMLFESGRSRYLIQFLPYLALLSGIGFDRFCSSNIMNPLNESNNSNQER